jgi:hypothetical protein
MIQLTDKQKEAILKLGRFSEIEAIPLDVLNELLNLGLIYRRSDGNFDSTDAGERIYNQLALKRK